MLRQAPRAALPHQHVWKSPVVSVPLLCLLARAHCHLVSPVVSTRNCTSKGGRGDSHTSCVLMLRLNMSGCCPTSDTSSCVCKLVHSSLIWLTDCTSSLSSPDA